MKLFQFLIIAFLGSFVFTSCSDGSDPTIVLNIEQEDNIYTEGETVFVIATLTDGEGLSSVSVAVEELAVTGESLLDNTVTETIEFEIITVDADTPKGDFDVEFTVTDSDGNTANESIGITIE